ncbi:hypothetical protein FM105_03975 [Brevibacterium yomogidense]|uniref:Uncharacterized protein n=2 Tax=Brevibacterium yomogidense TaxID=946573 RepID=A0A1X6X563_9MICO|nr:hypothetical protein FM105_03975 [Brevibacterium yomogidense]
MTDVFANLARNTDHRQDWGMEHSEFSDFIGFEQVHADQAKYLPAEVTA